MLEVYGVSSFDSLKGELKIKNRYFVYRFLNENNVIIYVGRTQNLQQRFIQHYHLNEDVVKIEYIECQTEADMVWREIYYINLYYNEMSTNISDVYDNGKITNMYLEDKWIEYKIAPPQRVLKNNLLVENYTKHVLNLPDYNYAALIHIIENEKLNRIGKTKYSLSRSGTKNIKMISK